MQPIAISKRQLLFMMVGIAVVTAVTTALSLTYFQNRVSAQEAPQSSLGTTTDVASAITYQGYLEDDNGPVSGTVNMRFRLYDAESNGTQLGEVTVNDVAVSNGRFTTTLDFGADAYAGQSVWLEIAVQPDDVTPLETLTPRQPITPAPIAQSLPNVYTDPATGFVGIGTSSPISSFTQLQVQADTTNAWGGMYVATSGTLGKPFYGYSLDGQSGVAWHQYNGSTNAWELHVGGNLRMSVTNAGELTQPLANTGLVKAAAAVNCADAGASVIRSVNNVSVNPISVANGVLPGECVVDFTFDISERYWTATAVQTIDTIAVTCNLVGTNALECLRWNADGTAVNGEIIVTIQ